MNEQRRTVMLTAWVVWGVLTPLLLASGCGGGGSGRSGGGGVAAAATTTVSGKATKGPVASGTVQAFAMDATTGLKTGSALASATTGSNGSFSLAIPASHTGALFIEVISGTYKDEATGNTVTLTAGKALNLSIPDLSTSSGLAITPLTTMADKLMQSQVGAQGLATAIQNANAQIAVLFGLSSIVTQTPADLTTVTAVNDASKQALVLAGLSQRAKNIGGGADALDLTGGLASDLSDGVLDGKSSGAQVVVGGTNLTANTTKADLQASMDLFANTTFAQQNPTASALPAGLTGTALNQGANSLPTTPTVTSVNPASGSPGSTQTITISGAGYATTGTVQILVGTTAATNVIVGSSTSLSASVPASLVAGSYDVTVINPATASVPALRGTKVGAYTVIGATTTTSLWDSFKWDTDKWE